MKDVVDREVELFRALAHPIRLGIMRRLAAEPETCACDFTSSFSVSPASISQHLKVLRDVGLVRTRRRSTQICYSIQPAGLRSMTEVLDSLRPAPDLEHSVPSPR